MLGRRRTGAAKSNNSNNDDDDFEDTLSRFSGDASSSSTKQHLGSRRYNSSHNSHNSNSQSNNNDIEDWIERRQRSFWDFEHSFSQPFGTNSISSAFQPLPPLRPIFTRPLTFEDSLVKDDSDPFCQPFFRRPRNMLAARDDVGDEMSPKAKVTYDEDKFQVEFQVKDYRPEELSIKTEGDVLVVMGKHETKVDGGSSFVSKQFEQKFSLPSGVKPEAITSSLSRDCVLTVTAPRESRRSLTHHNTSSSSIENKSGDELLSSQPRPKVSYDSDKFEISIDCSRYKPEELDVKVEGNTIIITCKQEIKEVGGVRSRVFEQKFTLPTGVKGDRVTSSMNKDGILTITAPRGTASASSINQTIEQRIDRVLSPSNWDDDFSTRRSSSTTSSSMSTSTPSKPSTTSTMQQHFTTRDLVPDRSFFDDDLDVIGTGAAGKAKVQVEDDIYKIQIDVKNFEPEELVIKTVGNTVQVEAKHEEKTSSGHSFSSRSFSQSYSLPRGVDPDQVTSSLAKDGTLTIAVPLPQPMRLQAGERLVPIKHS